jgi:LacI family transcriptional regulator
MPNSGCPPDIILKGCFMETKVSMRDIARELGVSIVAVSKALTGREGVSEALREKIKYKAKEMGYIYNSLPKSMLTGRKYQIGILIASHFLGEFAFYWLVFMQLLESFKSTEYFALLEIVNEEAEKKCLLPALVRANKVDGLIVLGQFSEDYLNFVTQKMPACLFLDFNSSAGSCDRVVSNNFDGAYNLTKLLLEAGHKRIAFIGTTSATTSILDRFMGYSKALLEAGFPPLPPIPDRDEKHQGYHASEIDLRIGEEAGCTAYVCNNDQLAGTVIRYFKQRGIRIPDDISLAGFDNNDIETTEGIGITSLAPDIESMCSIAVSNLITRIEDPGYRSRGQIFVNGRIVSKESIAPPKGGDA